jgi:hypothetical protein
MLQSQIALLRLSRYFEAVDDWNFALWLNRNKSRLLVGERQAKLLFLAYRDDDVKNSTLRRSRKKEES